MKHYRIKDWNIHFENNRTRELKYMDWIPIPNRHDGDGYTTLVDRENGASLLGAWLAILQVASRCDVRGTLLRDAATPHDATSISRITRIPKNVIEAALEVLVEECKWVEIIGETENPAPIPHNPAPSCGEVTTERNGTERNGIDREKNKSLEVELPLGFPKTEAEAKAIVGTVGCAEEFAVETWNKAMGRHGRDAKDVPIRSWPHYLKSELNFQKNRQEAEKARPQFRNGRPQMKAEHEKGF